jgi:hypothetical protein
VGRELRMEREKLHAWIVGMWLVIRTIKTAEKIGKACGRLMARKGWVDRLTFDGLHGVISQKTEIFVTTALKTSNHTPLIMF